MKTTDVYLKVTEVYGLFADAILTDESGRLVFGSFWGSDTSVRDFQGRLTLATQDGGMTAFNVFGDDCDGQTHKVYVRVDNIENIKQETGRVHTDILGDVVHCFLYHVDIIKPDLVNHRAILINNGRPHELWNAVKMICPVPLLDHWEDYLMPIMIGNEMIKSLSGINQAANVISIDEDMMASIVKTGCLNGSLTVTANNKFMHLIN